MVKAVAQSLADDIRESVAPGKYAEVVQALRDELGLDRDDGI